MISWSRRVNKHLRLAEGVERHRSVYESTDGSVNGLVTALNNGSTANIRTHMYTLASCDAQIRMYTYTLSCIPRQHCYARWKSGKRGERGSIDPHIHVLMLGYHHISWHDDGPQRGEARETHVVSH